MSFSPNLGVFPKHRKTSIDDMFRKWCILTNDKTSRADFEGTNVHGLFNFVLDFIDEATENYMISNDDQFEYLKDFLNVIINGSLGSSMEGWINVFKPLCTSIDIITADDSRVSHISDVNDRPVAGEIIVYFDNLSTKKEDTQAIHDAWLKCKNIAEPTKGGDKKINILYSNGDVKEYLYYNLLPESYTKINVRYKVEYQKESIEYPDILIETHIKETYEKINKINQSFYPRATYDVTNFVGVADILLQTKLASEDSSKYKEGIRDVKLGNKYILESVKKGTW